MAAEHIALKPVSDGNTGVSLHPALKLASRFEWARFSREPFAWNRFPLTLPTPFGPNSDRMEGMESDEKMDETVRFSSPPDQVINKLSHLMYTDEWDSTTEASMWMDKVERKKTEPPRVSPSSSQHGAFNEKLTYGACMKNPEDVRPSNCDIRFGAKEPLWSPERNCAGCRQTITEDHCLSLSDGQLWHTDCLVCSHCGMSLSAEPSCFSRAGKIYCKTDYFRLFNHHNRTASCASCDQPINAHELVMRSHAAVFHYSCFVCRQCHRCLRPGDRYTIRDGQLICQNELVEDAVRKRLISETQEEEESEKTIRPDDEVEKASSPSGLQTFAHSPELAALGAVPIGNRGEIEKINSDIRAGTDPTITPPAIKRRDLDVRISDILTKQPFPPDCGRASRTFPAQGRKPPCAAVERFELEHQLSLNSQFTCEDIENGPVPFPHTPEAAGFYNGRNGHLPGSDSCLRLNAPAPYSTMPLIQTPILFGHNNNNNDNIGLKPYPSSLIPYLPMGVSHPPNFHPSNPITPPLAKVCQLSMDSIVSSKSFDLQPMPNPLPMRFPAFFSPASVSPPRSSLLKMIEPDTGLFTNSSTNSNLILQQVQQKRNRKRRSGLHQTFDTVCLNNPNGYGGHIMGMSTRQKRMRTSFKHHQLRAMKAYFNMNHNPDVKDLKVLTEKTGLSKRVLQVWFQNARAKYRRGLLRQDNLNPTVQIPSGGMASSSTGSGSESGNRVGRLHNSLSDCDSKSSPLDLNDNSSQLSTTERILSNLDNEPDQSEYQNQFSTALQQDTDVSAKDIAHMSQKSLFDVASIAQDIPQPQPPPESPHLNFPSLADSMMLLPPNHSPSACLIPSTLRGSPDRDPVSGFSGNHGDSSTFHTPPLPLPPSLSLPSSEAILSVNRLNSFSMLPGRRHGIAEAARRQILAGDYYSAYFEIVMDS
ncbi:unnamed protein product [Calicophoron daubneyi]|uniref:Uncharacterized protein n=1 Tax=Calicophoron daubneyi TaxID=300641 RepID=A0AAV2TVU4_CALDB